MADTRSVGAGSGGFGTRIVNLVIEDTNSTSGESNRFTYAISNANSRFHVDLVNLPVGETQIDIPATSGGVVVVPPSANTQGIRLMLLAAQETLSLNTKGIYVLTWPTTPDSYFILKNTGASTISDVRLFWI